jgi:hypothetical protein
MGKLIPEVTPEQAANAIVRGWLVDSFLNEGGIESKS